MKFQELYERIHDVVYHATSIVSALKILQDGVMHSLL